MRKREQSDTLFRDAQKIIPGGVNSPVRAFRAVGGDPLFLVRGEGAQVWDADGNAYVDFCGSWGPLILGHAHPAVVSAAAEALKNGLSFGACTPGELKLAKLLTQLIPQMEMVRLVTSGTEATMTAVRLARAHTKRNKIIKCAGCYHGHADAFLIAAGSGLLTQGVPSSAGVTESVAADTLIVPFNDIESLKAVYANYPNEIAAMIIEPVPGNMGLVMPDEGYLQAVCELAETHGALTIFDEVINGFRLAPTAYANTVGLSPDLITLGKIIGGGMPVGALGGRRELMEQLAPLGPVYQAGTLSGNPVATAAGATTLQLLADTNPYPELARKGRALADEINAIFKSTGIPGHCASAGALFTIFFTETPSPLRNLEMVSTCDTSRFARYFQGMIQRGFYLPPAQFEAAFLSTTHTDAHLNAFLAAFRNAIVL